MKKILYLFLALLLPALIFVFLKYAGKNEFTIPVYYESEVADSLKEGCPMTYTSPYHVPDSVLEEGNNFEAYLFIFSEKGFGAGKLNADMEEELGKGTFSSRVVTSGMSEDINQNWRCIFLLKGPWQVVLVDKQKRIRGYYDPRLREELDRLRVELKILLKRY